ncbi:MAG TPA: efflux RND transporter periplasmic adaptor subunit, partial [Bacteroidia bacterium]|nr:efflux RND transporter periplasmic adaptor subunit [Bacteroidia bacterium]
LIIVPKLKSENKDSPQESSGPPGAEKSIMTVSGYVVKPEKLDNIVRTSGTVVAFEEVDLVSETSGRIIKIYFTEGSHVKKGDLLIKINDEDLQAQLKKTELQIKLAEGQEGRQNQLLKISATSQEEYDIVMNQLGSMKADRDIIKAAINKTEIRSPFNGVIGLKYVNEGSYVSPSTRIASVQNINPVKVDFSIPEKYSGMVLKGDEVNFSSEATSQQFTGKVFAIEPKIDLTTRTLQIRAICDNQNEKIMPGSFAKIELRLKETTDALMIPTQALIPVLKGQTVFICKDGLAQSVPVKTGVRTDAKVQITEGISANDTIITTGINSLKPKAPVKVIVK